jgi:diguanylate cyclase (GGDEF)-like protein/PAS domain S-box-containing protein
MHPGFIRSDDAATWTAGIDQAPAVMAGESAFQQRDNSVLLSLVADRIDRAAIVTDDQERILYVNAAFTRMFGYVAADAIGRAFSALLASGAAGLNDFTRREGWLGIESRAEEEFLAYGKDGDEVWISAAFNAVRDEHGRLQNLVALLTDITESKRLRSLQYNMLEALANETPIKEVVARLCREVEAITPDIVCSVLRVDRGGLLHPLGSPSLPEDYSDALDGVAIGPDRGSCGTAAFLGEPVFAEIETSPLWVPFKDVPLSLGLRACWSTPIKAKDGRVIGTFAFYFRDTNGPSPWHHSIVDACVHLGALAIEREETRAEIARLAYHDTLTGLPNRTQLLQTANQLLAAAGDAQRVALMFLDLDQFKDVNDTLGHSVGDELLVSVTQRLRKKLRSRDMLSRHGGDEFVIVLPDCDAEGAAAMADRILEGLRAPFALDGRMLAASVSIGISIFPDYAGDIDSLMKQADAAMYKAKQAGRSTYRFFNAEMDRSCEQRLAFGMALRRAVAQNELKLHYQPQIRAADGAVYGVEALARWHDPVLGDVPPSRFIPFAEESGLIAEIGLWSLREACRQIAEWRRLGLNVPCVSVNLSPINFQSADLAAQVADVIAEYGLPPEALMLEITEGVFMDERSTAIQTMHAIRALGVGLSLDDFGTGYSSLSRLAHLPIRELKIDRSFMRNIESGASARAIATAVVRVGQSLNMVVVAEGIETNEQRALLTELGCDAMQGYLYAPALPVKELERWLAAYDAGRDAAAPDVARHRTAHHSGFVTTLAPAG